MKFDYRAARRLHLRKPAPAMFSMWQVKILDVSASGLGVAHGGELKPGDSGYIEFTWQGTKVMLACTVVHSRPLTPAQQPATLGEVRTLPADGWVGLGGNAPAFRSGLAVREQGSPALKEYRQRVALHVDKMKTAERAMPSLLPDVDDV